MYKYLNKLSQYSKYEIEILEYGLKVVFFNFISIFVIILLSIFLHNLLFGIIFIISFGTIRVLIGGFHCKSLVSCLISFCILYLLTYYLSSFIYFQLFLKTVFVPCNIYLYYGLKKEYSTSKIKYLIPLIFISIICFINNYVFLPLSSGLCLGILLNILKLMDKKHAF